MPLLYALKILLDVYFRPKPVQIIEFPCNLRQGRDVLFFAILFQDGVWLRIAWWNEFIAWETPSRFQDKCRLADLTTVVG